MKIHWISTCSVAVENVARKLPRVAGSGQFLLLTESKNMIKCDKCQKKEQNGSMN